MAGDREQDAGKGKLCRGSWAGSGSEFLSRPTLTIREGISRDPRWSETCRQPVAQLQSQTHKDCPKELTSAPQPPPEQQVCCKFFVLLPWPHVSVKHLEYLAAEQSSSRQGRL